MIPKILLQTSKEKLEQHVLDIHKEFFQDWQCLHFVDSEIIEFFENNPLKEFSDIVEVFNSIPRGEYKADLFRYYFLYLNGGVFVDSDLELKSSLNHYVENFNYFTVQAEHPNETCYFQGLLGVEPKNKIVHEALANTYLIFKKNKKIKFYVELCQRFKDISLKKESEYNVKIFKEVGFDGYTRVLDPSFDDKLIAVHFHATSMIPPPVNGEENTSRKQLVRAIFLNRLKREPDKLGLAHYVNSNLGIQEIDDIIIDSAEYKSL